jgi:hypothetical protein
MALGLITGFVIGLVVGLPFWASVVFLLMEKNSMSMTQFFASFSVAPPVATGPTLTPPTSAENPLEVGLQEGVAADGTVLCTASGGAGGPYSASLGAASDPLPPGLSVVMDSTATEVELAGTPAPGSSTGGDGEGNYTGVVIDVFDSAGAPVSQVKVAGKVGKTNAPAPPAPVKKNPEFIAPGLPKTANVK